MGVTYVAYLFEFPEEELQEYPFKVSFETLPEYTSCKIHFSFLGFSKNPKAYTRRDQPLQHVQHEYTPLLVGTAWYREQDLRSSRRIPFESDIVFLGNAQPIIQKYSLCPFLPPYHPVPEGGMLHWTDGLLLLEKIDFFHLDRQEVHRPYIRACRVSLSDQHLPLKRRYPHHQIDVRVRFSLVLLDEVLHNEQRGGHRGNQNHSDLILNHRHIDEVALSSHHLKYT